MNTITFTDMKMSFFSLFLRIFLLHMELLWVDNPVEFFLLSF